MAAPIERVNFAGTFNPENARRARWARRRTDGAGAVGVIVGVFLMLFPLISDPKRPDLNSALVSVCGAIIVCLFWIWPGLRTRKSWRAVKRQIPVSGSLTQAGLEFRWKGSSSVAAWSNFTKARVVGGTLFLEDLSDQLTYLPRDFFATDEEWRAAITLVEAQVREHSSSSVA